MLHGPGATPLTGERADPRRRAFHGIASLGLLRTLPPGAERDWQRIAPWLDAALSGDTPGNTLVPPALVAAARACGVLSFADGMAVAASFAAERLGAIAGAAGLGAGLEPVELWHVKEGHTSSVWRATLRRSDGGPRRRVALNVARDRLAGYELERSASVLDVLHAASSVPVARVIGRDRVRHPRDPDTDVAVVVQDWFAGARELGFAATSAGIRLHAIDAFVVDGHEPGRIVGVRGMALGDEEHHDAAYAVTRVLLAGAMVDAGGTRVTLPRLDVHHGDCVWYARQIGVVAAAGAPEVVPRADARVHLLSLLARRYAVEDDRGRQLLWSGAAAALRDAGPDWLES